MAISRNGIMHGRPDESCGSSVLKEPITGEFHPCDKLQQRISGSVLYIRLALTELLDEQIGQRRIGGLGDKLNDVQRPRSPLAGRSFTKARVKARKMVDQVPSMGACELVQMNEQGGCR